MIKVHDILKPQNHTFPLAETNDLKGTYKVFDTFAEMESADMSFIMPGTMCYITEDDQYYRWYSGKRLFPFELYGLEVDSNYAKNTDNTQAHLSSPMQVQQGDTLYFNGNDYYFSIYSRANGLIRGNIRNSSYAFTRYYYDIYIIAKSANNQNLRNNLLDIAKCISIEGPSELYEGWVNVKFANIYVGESAPLYTDTVWVDTAAGKNPSVPEAGDIITTMQNDIAALQKMQAKLKLLISAGIRAGDSTVGNDVNVDILNMNTMTSKNVPYNVQNIAIKYDLLSNFQNNRSKLVNGEPVFATDQQQLYIFYNNNLIPINGDNTYSAPIPLMTQHAVNIISTDSPQEINKFLKIRSCFYTDKENLDAAATHNFIELTNTGDNNLNISNNYILITENEEVKHIIKLDGVINAKSNYIIKGDRISYESNITLNIYGDQGDKFTLNENSVLYLTYTEQFVNKKVSQKGKSGYIDSLKGQHDYKVININSSEINIDDAVKYNKVDELLYKDFEFSKEQPNCITQTLGYYATVSAEHKATRNFCWVSQGCYDEYIIIDGCQIKSDMTKWVYNDKIMTSHKVSVKDLEEGEHDFYIYRNQNYKSDVYKFYVYNDDELDERMFTFGISNKLLSGDITDTIKKCKFNEIVNGIFNINVSGITKTNDIAEWNSIPMFDMPVIGKDDSLEYFKRFYNIEYDENSISEYIYRFTYGNYYFVVVGNTNITKEQLKVWLFDDKNFEHMYKVLITPSTTKLDIFDKVYNINNSSMMKVTTNLIETEETIKDELIEEKITL